MRYRRPFTEEQQQRAAQVYRSYRRNYRLIRERYGPQTRKEQELLRGYRRRIKEFGAEAAADLRKIDPERLGDLESRCCQVLGEYLAERMKSRGV